jgi:hypothetical protein
LFKLFILILLYSTISSSNEISTLISNIKNANDSKKRLLINKLKVKLRASNNKQRIKVMTQLRQSHNIKQNNTYHRVAEHNIKPKENQTHYVARRIEEQHNTPRLIPTQFPHRNVDRVPRQVNQNPNKEHKNPKVPTKPPIVIPKLPKKPPIRLPQPKHKKR